MSRIVAAGALAALFLWSAAPPAAAQVQATDAWARATIGGQTSSAAYMQLRSKQPASVVAVDSPLGTAELHEMRMDGNIMRMRSLERLELPAGRTVELAPAGVHIMLTALKRPLAGGDRVPLRLTIEGQGGSRAVVEVSAEVRDLASGGASHRH